jgi:GNAT superfamily N-acetyltransferase
MSFLADQASENDWQSIRTVCAMTGAPGGEPVEVERREFFSELWVGPYQKLAPDWTYVLRGASASNPGASKIAGYLVAAPDTRDFERRRLVSCEIPLFGQVLLGRFERTADAWKFIRRFLLWDPRPKDLFSRALWKELYAKYPAHLHMNLLPPHRRKGHGSKLVQRLCADLKNSGVAGVHCICGDQPKPFYENQGFEVLEEVLVGGRVRLFAMGRRIVPRRDA